MCPTRGSRTMMFLEDAMSTTTIEPSRWQSYFDDLSRRLPARKIEVDVLGEDIGDRRLFEGAMLTGLSYDPTDDLIEVSVEGDAHQIGHPKSVQAREERGELDSLEIVDEDDHRQIITFRAPSALPG